jgi:hypothetical protein
MKPYRSLIPAALCACLALPAAAQDKPAAAQDQPRKEDQSAAAGASVPLPQDQTRQQLFERLDANGSGSVSRSEAEAAPALVVIFVEMDANADGELSAPEFERVPLRKPDGSAAQ